MEHPEDRRVKLVAYRLKGAASAWRERLQDTRRYEGKGQPPNMVLHEAIIKGSISASQL